MRVEASTEPEQLIAASRSQRHWMVLLALCGIAIALGVIFSATGAMYAKDPMRELQIEKAALQPSSEAAP